MKNRGIPRKVRLQAAELAASCFHGEFEGGGPMAGRLFALCIFFEQYIVNGADATEKSMRLLSRKRVGKLKVVAGGRL
jgi:hypothetical protein